MKKKIVKFIASYGSYVTDDIAGFEPELARELIDVKEVAIAHVPENEGADDGNAETVTLAVDSASVRAEIARQVDQAKAELADEAKARSDDLDAREDDLVKREGDLTTAEGDLKTRTEELERKEKAVAAKADKTDASSSKQPPKQGGK